MMYLRALLCLIALTPVSAAAEGPTWADGTVSVGTFGQDGGEGYIFGDFTLSYQRGAWGGELGMFGVVGRLHETYAALTYEAPNTKISLGFPRPAYDAFATSALGDITPRLSLDSIGQVRSRATHGTMVQTKFLPYGATVARSSGPLSYQVSLHAVPDYPDVIAGAGLRWGQGGWQFEAAAEAVTTGDATRWNTKAQAITGQGRMTWGLGLFDGHANDQDAMAEGIARFDLNDKTAITGVLRRSPSRDATFGIGVSQQVTPVLTLQAGAVGTDADTMRVSVALEAQF